MMLKEYIEKFDVNKMKFMKKVNIAASTFYKVLNEETEPSLSQALKIEALTQGEVTCRDLSLSSETSAQVVVSKKKKSLRPLKRIDTQT
jgi:predicted transcriptional regulator